MFPWLVFLYRYLKLLFGHTCKIIHYSGRSNKAVLNELMVEYDNILGPQFYRTTKKEFKTTVFFVLFCFFFSLGTVTIKIYATNAKDTQYIQDIATGFFSPL